jgi:hypothetical protein
MQPDPSKNLEKNASHPGAAVGEKDVDIAAFVAGSETSLDPHVAAHIRFVSDIFFFAQLT